jgi:hypothetical protein
VRLLIRFALLFFYVYLHSIKTRIDASVIQYNIKDVQVAEMSELSTPDDTSEEE